MGLVRGYSLDLYCEHPGHRHFGKGWPTNFSGETFSECAAAARKEGWIVVKSWPERKDYSMGSGFCLCPEHRDFGGPTPRRKGGAR